ncbi:MAG: hypothetical protein IJW55_03540 [Clostridia bacterium]|nr:hypothetical protein [Clostridia bacterium]
MKNNLTKQFCLFFALVLMIPLMASCKKEEQNTPEDTTVKEASGYENPVEVMDFQNKEFVFMGTLWHSYEPLNYTDIAPETTTGDFVVDAAYERCAYIEETYNCIVSLEDVAYKDLLTSLEQNAMAGDEAADYVLLRGTHYVSAINGGFLAEMSSYDLDYSAEWWDSTAIDALTINGKNYGVIGDVTINHLMAVWMTCFNKTMIENYTNLENPYDMVNNGTWTFENVIRIAREFSNDEFDGTAGMSRNDLWGINYTRDTVMGLLAASGIKIVEKNSNGVPELVITKYQSEVQNIFEKLYDESYAADTMNELCLCENTDTEIFDEGRVLFLFTATHNSTALRNSEVDYGIVPYPKASPEADYISTTAGNFLTILGIPVSNQNYKTASVFLEAFAAYGNKEVRPEFYENVLLRRVGGRDEESYEMLKYIFENIQYDIGTIYDIAETDIRDTARTLNTNFASLVGDMRVTWKADLQTLLDNFKPTEGN